MRIMSMGERFCIMVQLGYFTSLSDMRERVINQSSNDPSASREKMMQSFQNSDDVACMEDELSLRCKISMARIRTPVKGLKCRHLQCFDLDTFLEFARRHSHWLCPNCDQPLCASDLRVDALFEQRRIGRLATAAQNLALGRSGRVTIPSRNSGMTSVDTTMARSLRRARSISCSMTQTRSLYLEERLARAGTAAAAQVALQTV
jgi:hypothetical protein